MVRHSFFIQTGALIYRVLQFAMTIVCTCGLIYGGRWLLDSTPLPIQVVKVHASYLHVDRSALQAEISPYVQQGFLWFKSHLLKETLSAQFPWIAQIEIQRIWPHTVVITLVEHEAVARWGDKALVNPFGQLFSPPISTFPKELPQLYGDPEDFSTLWKNYQIVLPLLRTVGLEVAKFGIDGQHSWQLLLTNGTLIRLGKTEPLLRLRRFVKVYPRIFTDPTKYALSIDLRYQNGLSIHWAEHKPGTTL